MKGKCFPCASLDPLANNCSLAKEIKCKWCNTADHITAAFMQGGQAKSNPTG